MTRREEKQLLKALDNTYREVHENNIMLRQIMAVLRYYISNASRENEHDFGRNVLANILSNILELGKLQGQ